MRPTGYGEHNQLEFYRHWLKVMREEMLASREKLGDHVDARVARGVEMASPLFEQRWQRLPPAKRIWITAKHEPLPETIAPVLPC